MSFKESVLEFTSVASPSSARFLTPTFAELAFSYENVQIGQVESLISYASLKPSVFTTPMQHLDNVKLSSISPNGELKAVIRSIPHSSKMPSTTPKIGERVNYLEVFKDGKLIVSRLLEEEYGDVQTFATITSGIVWSPDSKMIVWTVSEKHKFERKSEIGYTIPLFNPKDYGEDIDGVYRSILVGFNVETQEIRLIGAPKGFGACKCSFASNDVLLLQAIDLSTPHILGIRSYANRMFRLFALKLNQDSITEKLLIGDEIVNYPACYPIDDKTTRCFCGIFPKNFGGHGGPHYPATFKLNLETLEMVDFKKSEKEIGIINLPFHHFISESIILINTENRCRIVPVLINLETLECNNFLNLDPLSSVICEDYLDDQYLIKISTPNTYPAFAIYKDTRLTYLSETKTLDFSVELLQQDNYNDAILLIAPGEEKKFIVTGHGGPHGMFSTYFSRFNAFFAAHGFSVAAVNYRGSTGYPLEVQKSLPGKCGTQDVEDLCQVIDYIRSKYNVKTLGTFGFSHGGFLSAHMAGQHSDKIDFAIAGGPVVDLISSFFTCDIPDWNLVESGVMDDATGNIDVDENVLHAMWKMSPIQYVKNVNVPILLIHGHNDRRVNHLQSVEYYCALKRNNKDVRMLIYENNNHSFKGVDSCYDFLTASCMFANDPKGFIAQENE